MGGERMRFTVPALITSAIKLCRRYKNREDEVSRRYSQLLRAYNINAQFKP